MESKPESAGKQTGTGQKANWNRLGSKQELVGKQIGTSEIGNRMVSEIGRIRQLAIGRNRRSDEAGRGPDRLDGR